MKCQRGCKTKNKHDQTCSDNECWGCAIIETNQSTCSRCESQFGNSLMQLCDVWSQLDSLLVAPQSHEIKEHISGTPSRGLVINEKVLNMKASVRDWAVFVHRIIVSESETETESKDSSTVEILRFIHSMRPWLLDHELAVELVNDAVAHVRKVSKVINPVGRKHFAIRASTCQAETETGACNGRLYAVLSEVKTDKALATYCAKDGTHRVEVEYAVAVAKEVREWITPEQAASQLGVTYSHVLVLAHRQKWDSIRKGKHYFYSSTSVGDYQEKRAVK